MSAQPNAQPDPHPEGPHCPRCHGPMPSPIQVTEMQSNGIPRSYQVCRHCHRQWIRGGGKFEKEQEKEQ